MARKPYFRAFDGWWYAQVRVGAKRKQIKLVTRTNGARLVDVRSPLIGVDQLLSPLVAGDSVHRGDFQEEPHRCIGLANRKELRQRVAVRSLAAQELSTYVSVFFGQAM